MSAFVDDHEGHSNYTSKKSNFVFVNSALFLLEQLRKAKKL